MLRFMVTERGYIGLAYPSAMPGDKVTLLLGAPVPLVLREFSQGHALIGQRFVADVSP